MDELTDRGIAAVKAGNKPLAQKLLEDALRQDTDNLQAWLWLSGVLDSIEEKIECLENVVRLDPTNQAATRGLKSLKERLKKKERFSASNAFILDETDPISLELLTSPLKTVKPTPPPAPIEDIFNRTSFTLGGDETPSQLLPAEPEGFDLDQRLKQVATTPGNVFSNPIETRSGRLNPPSDPSRTLVHPPAGPAGSSLAPPSQPRSSVFDVPSQPFSMDVSQPDQPYTISPPSNPKRDTVPPGNLEEPNISPSSRPRQPHTPIYNPYESDDADTPTPLEIYNRQKLERKSRSRPTTEVNLEGPTQEYDEEKGLGGFGGFMLVLFSVIILAILIMAYYFYRYL
jgi:hypothetical protein